MRLENYRNSIVIEKFNGECCESEVSRIESVIREKKIEVLAGIGGCAMLAADAIRSIRKGKRINKKNEKCFP